MPPRRKLATPSRRPKGPSKGVQKNRKSTLPKNTQSRQARSFIATAANSTPIQASPKLSTSSQELIAHPRTRAQKRKHIAEDERSQKRPRKNPQSESTPAAASQDPVSVSQTQANKRPRSGTESRLSEENLKKLQSQLKEPKEMESTSTSLDRVPKKGPSGPPTSSELNIDTASSVRSRKSAVSLKIYRYSILARARIYVRPEPPPLGIQSLLDVIFKREISEKRRQEISRIAKDISQTFIINTQGANSEDDLVEPVYKAFRAMFKETFNCPRKADWNPILKPDFQQEELWDPNALGQTNNETDNIVDRPSKRQQADRTFLSPNTSSSTVQPPAASSQPKQDDAVKNPRPDFMIGHHHSTITNALMERGLDEVKADDFLRYLQQQQKLYSDPTQDFLDVRFPILVIVGKAYTTGRTLFEAENQAAVSGGGMINVFIQLIDLFKSVFPDSKESKTPIAFSLCTQGPVIQLWVHHSSFKKNISWHYMNPLGISYGCLCDSLQGLLLQLEQLMNWYREDFLTEIVDQLYALANHTARS